MKARPAYEIRCQGCGMAVNRVSRKRILKFIGDTFYTRQVWLCDECITKLRERRWNAAAGDC